MVFEKEQQSVGESCLHGHRARSVSRTRYMPNFGTYMRDNFSAVSSAFRSDLGKMYAIKLKKEL
jgi:hypothetical protein